MRRAATSMIIAIFSVAVALGCWWTRRHVDADNFGFVTSSQSLTARSDWQLEFTIALILDCVAADEMVDQVRYI